MDGNTVTIIWTVIGTAAGAIIGFGLNYLTMRIGERRVATKQRNTFKRMEGNYNGYVFSNNHAPDRTQIASNARVTYLKENRLEIAVTETGEKNVWTGEVLMTGEFTGTIVWRYTTWHQTPSLDWDITGRKSCFVVYDGKRILIHLMDHEPTKFGKELLERVV